MEGPHGAPRTEKNPSYATVENQPDVAPQVPSCSSILFIIPPPQSNI